MSTYDTYKDSGISWLGQIPSHWDVKRAKVLFNKENRPVLPNDEVVTCFRDGQVTLRKNRRTEGFTESLKEIGYQGIRKGDLVIHQMDAFAGATGVSDSNGKGTPVYHVCTPKTDYVNNYYYAHIVRRMGLNGYIQSLYRGIRERSSDFRFDVFGRQFLPVPPLAEQEAIVAYLDSATAEIDKAIASQQRMVELLLERKQIIINQAVTQGLNPEAPMKPTNINWLPQIPTHWQIKKVKHICKMFGRIGFRGYTQADLVAEGEGAITLSPTNMDSIKVDYTKCSYLSWDKYFESPEIMVQVGDVLVVKTASVGKCSYVSELPCECTVNPQILVLKEIKENPLFLTYLLNTPMGQSLFQKNKGGSTIPTLSEDKIGNFVFAFPSLSDQVTIIKYIDSSIVPIDAAILRCKRKIELLTERKQILINDVVTGKIKVV